MAKYSQKVTGKEVGPASVYAEPHTMTGKKVKIEPAGVSNNKEYLRNANVSVANSHSNDYPGVQNLAASKFVAQVALQRVYGSWPHGVRTE
jgi:hypothetical protein